LDKRFADSDEDHEKEESQSVPPDYTSIESFYRFNYANYKKLKKEFPENNR
jgi:hypothetical protein